MKEEKIKETLKEIIRSLESEGYNAYKQITEYLISGDMGYIASFENSRKKINDLNRSEIIEIMLKEYTK